MVDGLLAAGVEPWISLLGLGIPDELHANGGWMNRDVAFRFADFAERIGAHFTDRVAAFSTVDHPYSVMKTEYAEGLRPPGKSYGMAALAAGHHQLLAHGQAVQALRATTTARLGPVNSYAPAWPGSDEPKDRLASLAVDAVHNQFFTKPLFGGGYPMLVIDLLRRLCPQAISVIKPDDVTAIAQPIDFLGVSCGEPDWVRADESAPLRVRSCASPVPPGRVDVAAALGDVLSELHQHHPDCPPLYVDLGAAQPSADPGAAADEARIASFEAHLAAIGKAMEQGVNVGGYFADATIAEWVRTRVTRLPATA